jgi:hypothetical protein
MVIAVPTGIKIFSWLSYSFSKSNSALNLILFLLYTYFIFNNDNFIISDSFYSNLNFIPISNSTKIYPEDFNYKLFDLHKGNLLKIFPRSNPYYMKENTHCKSLVLYGSNLESSVNKPKFTSIVSYMVNIPNNILSPLIGIILSDGYIEYKSRKTLNAGKGHTKNKDIYSNINSRFRFKQSIDHFEYLYYVFNIVSPYCISYPKIVKARLNRRDFYGVEIITRALPCFTYLRDIFYRNRIKIIPDNLYELLTLEGLSHIIMGDGAFKHKGIILNLQSFSVKELILFINVLKLKFDIDSTLHKSRNQYTVYIRVDSAKKLYPKIKKFIVPSPACVARDINLKKKFLSNSCG